MQPTLCSRCKKNVAVIFITRLEGGQAKNEGLCLKCARELHIKPVDDVINKMGLSDDELDAVAGGGATVCMMNNITYQQYKQGEIDNMLEMFKGRAGLRCPQCGKFVTPQVAEMGTYYTCPSCGHTGTDFVMCSAPR